jgi:hypothetical protein
MMRAGTLGAMWDKLGQKTVQIVEDTVEWMSPGTYSELE